MIQSIQMFGKSISKEMNKTYFHYVHRRYTASKTDQIVYAHLLVWPSNTTEIILGVPVSSSSTIITLLGSNIGPLDWHAAGENSGILIDLSNVKIYSLESDWVWVFKLQNISVKKPDKIQKSYRHW